MGMLGLLALAAAWVSQHHFDMQPCPWCILQRLIFGGLVVLALLQLVLERAQGVRSLPAHAVSGLRASLALAGVAAAAWQHTVAASSVSCNLTWADRFIAATGLDGAWPDFFQPRANCMEAKAWILGVPYEFYSGGLFLLMVLAIILRWRAVVPSGPANAAGGDAQVRA